MSYSITCPSKILTLAIASFLFLSVGHSLGKKRCTLPPEETNALSLTSLGLLIRLLLNCEKHKLKRGTQLCAYNVGAYNHYKVAFLQSRFIFVRMNVYEHIQNLRIH